MGSREESNVKIEGLQNFFDGEVSKMNQNIDARRSTMFNKVYFMTGFNDNEKVFANTIVCRGVQGPT